MSVNHNLSQAETFWRQLLRGFTAPTPLVVDRVSSDGPDQDGEYGEQEIRLSEATTTALQSLLQQHQLMFDTIIQGAWALLLSRYNGEEDVLLGVTRAGRRSAVEGTETMVGLFINTLPVRVRVPPEKPLLSWLKELQTQHITLRKYEHISLAKIQEWTDIPSEMPLFESVLIFENNHSNSTLQALSGDLKNRNLRLLEQTNYPLTVRVSLDSEILLKIAYNRHRFDEATISRMLGHLKTVLEGMAPKSGEKLSTLPLLTEKEYHQMLVEWNDTQANYRQDQCLHHLFEAQVERTPEAIALIFEDESLSYRELNRRANQLAHYLRRLGVGPEVLVGICLERSLEMIIGLLGILKAGGAYVPLDPAYPQERLVFMLTDTQAPVLLTQTHLTAWLAKIKNLQVVCLDTDWDTIVQESEANPVTEITANNLAYVVYTSGSTGTPKGVAGHHKGAIDRFNWTWQTYPFEPQEICCQITTLSFIDSVWEIFVPLLQGIQTILIPDEVVKDPPQLVQTLATHRVTRMLSVPSLLRVILEAYTDLKSRLPHLKIWFTGGEALSIELAQRFQKSMPQSVLINGYGSAEVAGDSISYEIRKEQSLSCVPIGRPITNTQVYILDSYLQPVPIGVPGELHTGGDGLARGYLNRPALTSEKFISNPFSAEPEARLYKTGDLARYLPDGNIEFLGRIDHQVKIRGFRIELGEVERVLDQHPAIQETVVIAREDVPGDKRLVAYVCFAQDQTPSISDLRTLLKQKLPDYMVPATFVPLDSLPLTPNGKVDRRALPAPAGVRSDLETAFVAPRTPEEEIVAKIWAEVLNIDQVGVHDNFFELGGDSLMAIRLLTQIEKKTGKNLRQEALFQASTIEQLANILRQEAWVSPWSSLIAIQPAGSALPIFCIPGILGNVFNDLGDLAKYLGPNQPFYGLQDGVHNPAQIEALATHYVNEVRAVQPEGPYLLSGICSGGLVAFEMAQQILAQDQQIALLALIEAWYPVPGIQSYVSLVGDIFNGAVRRLGHHARKVSEINSTEWGNYIRLKVKLVANLWAMTRYTPQTYPGRIELFLTHESRNSVDNFEPYWCKLAVGGVEVHEIVGTHATVTGDNTKIEEAAMQSLAEHLRICLDKAMVTGS